MSHTDSATLWEDGDSRESDERAMQDVVSLYQSFADSFSSACMEVLDPHKANQGPTTAANQAIANARLILKRVFGRDWNNKHERIIAILDNIHFRNGLLTRYQKNMRKLILKANVFPNAVSETQSRSFATDMQRS